PLAFTIAMPLNIVLSCCPPPATSAAPSTAETPNSVVADMDHVAKNDPRRLGDKSGTGAAVGFQGLPDFLAVLQTAFPQNPVGTVNPLPSKSEIAQTSDGSATSDVCASDVSAIGGTGSVATLTAATAEIKTTLALATATDTSIPLPQGQGKAAEP